MPIKRSPPKEIDFKQGDQDEPTFCQHCAKVGLQIRLEPRLYGKDEIPYDDENWKQCYRCGRLVEIYNIKYESERLSGFTEPSDDPFDFGNSQISGLKKRDIHRDKDKEYEEIKENELKQELRHGSILLNYSDTQQ